VWAASDEALLAGLGTGDRDAALAFVRRFQSRVYGLAVLIVRDAGRAEDVAQEAFARAWRHAGAYDARRGSVTTWLLTITRNLAIDAVRVERARPADPTEAVDLRVADGIDPGEAAVHAAEVGRVTTALSRLPHEQRRALVLASLYGRSAREVSELEGIPLGTAKTRIRTALLRVRDDLDAAEHSRD
jgi:RNA polymerase sigma-70 factor (ECF subfamily)